MKASHTMASVNKLATLAESGIDNANWYDSAQSQIREVCELENWDIVEFTSKLAIFSPRVSVLRNIRFALQYAGDGSIFTNCLPMVVRSLRIYEKTGKIGGHKVPQFAQALLGDKSSIVLDSWMGKAFFGGDDGNISKNFRRKATMSKACERIREVASKLGISPRDCQACIWQGIIQLHKATPAKLSILAEYHNWLAYDRVFPDSGSVDNLHQYVPGEF